MKTKVSPGSAIRGTLRLADLIEAFSAELTALGGTPPEYDLADEEFAAEVVGELMDALDALAPPYMYFGSHPSDATDFGFWIDWELVEHDIMTGYLVQVEAGHRWPALDNDCEVVIEVNERGDATLYGRDGTELWSMV